MLIVAPGVPADKSLGAPLGINANTTDIGLFPDENSQDMVQMLQRLKRQDQFNLLAGAARLFKDEHSRFLLEHGTTPEPGCSSKQGYHRVCRCLWTRWQPTVEVGYSSAKGKASYRGLQTCGSWSACPVCASKISEVRRGELSSMVKVARDRGFVIALATFTLPHVESDDLAALVEQLLGAFSDFKKDYGYKLLVRQFGFDGPGRGDKTAARLYGVRAFECTYGYNGFHPHLHVLFVLRPGADVSAFQSELRHLWYRALGNAYLPDPSTGELVPADSDRWEHGCVATSNDGEVADYLAKWGHDPRWDVSQELTKANSKRGRSGLSKHYSMIDLLASYVEDGNTFHGVLWLRFARVMKGRAQLTWSPGLRSWAGLQLEQTDEEIAAAPAGDFEILVALGPVVWAAVRGGGLRARLLNEADFGSKERVLNWLASLMRKEGGASAWLVPPALHPPPREVPQFLQERG